MELAAFIRSNEDVIVEEWEAFAHAYVHSAAHMDRSTLRDHIKGCFGSLQTILRPPKPNGSGARKPRDRARKREERLTVPPKPMLPFGYGGFDTIEMISEFRALRASVIKLWRSEWAKADASDILPDLLRFDEAIDQVMTESLGRFTQKLTRSGSVFVGTLVHDFRNPLAAVHNSAQALLARRKLDDEQAGLVSQIETSTSLVKRLVSDLIDAVRIPSPRGPADCARADGYRNRCPGGRRGSSGGAPRPENFDRNVRRP